MAVLHQNITALTAALASASCNEKIVEAAKRQCQTMSVCSSLDGQKITPRLRKQSGRRRQCPCGRNGLEVEPELKLNQRVVLPEAAAVKLRRARPDGYARLYGAFAAAFGSRH